jgi:monovalent cation/proton antiporter MnhG/PhaG subunit
MNETAMATNEIIGLALIVIGVLFDISGCVGLVRLPDVYNRIQASTKCVVLGTTLILLGAMVWLASPHAIVKGFICILFILTGGRNATRRGHYEKAFIPAAENSKAGNRCGLVAGLHDKVPGRTVRAAGSVPRSPAL